MNPWWSVCINRTRDYLDRRDQRSRRITRQQRTFSLKRWATTSTFSGRLGQLLFTVMHFHILSAGPRGPDHLTSDGTDVFQGMHECVLVAWPGDDNATEKSESRTRSLIQPTIPFAYLPPVVLTISGAPPVKNIKQSCEFSEKYAKEVKWKLFGNIVSVFSRLTIFIIRNFKGKNSLFL